MGTLGFNLSQLRKDAKTIEQITRSIDRQAKLTSRTFKDLGRDIDRALGKTTGQYRQHYRDVDRVTREGSRGRVKVIREGYTEELKNLKTHARQIEGEHKNLQNRLTKAAGKPLGVGTKDQQYDNLIKSLGYRADWFVSGAIFYGSIRASRKLLDIIRETEMGMINLQKVMQGHATDYDRLQEDLMNLGQAYGYLNKEVLDVSTIWAQAGMRQGEIEELTRVTLLNMNVGMMNAEESARYLLATLKQYNMEVKDSITIVDMANEVANNYAVTNKDLMEAMAITGSVARNVGVTMEELIGHITALSESTARSGNEIGNALKTIYSYIYRPGTINVFENLGIQVRDGADGFRDLNLILKDVQAVWRDMTEQQQTEMVVSLEETAEAWQTLSEAEQMELSMSAAGVRRRNFFISLIESMNTALEATERAHYSLGSAERENEKYMESYNKRLDQLHSSIQELAVAMGESGLLEVLKENVTTMKVLVDWYNELPEPITDVTNKIALLTGAILMLNVAARVFVGEGIFAYLIKRTTALATAAAGAEVATHTLGQSLTYFAQAPLSVIGPMGIFIATLGTLAAIALKTRKEYIKQQEEMKKSLGTIEGLEKEYGELQNRTEELQKEYETLTEQLKELNEGTNKHAEAMGRVVEITKELNNVKTEEQSITNQIAEMLPTVVLEYDRLGNAVRVAWNEVANLIDQHKEFASLSSALGWDMTTSEMAARRRSMERFPEHFKRQYRKEYQEL
ncbi:MAG TPA: phage tail tape measure protein, partial [Firmicutes bacterium]|nr:phage tail tape measure protein [Bacillota bacterium]